MSGPGDSANRPTGRRLLRCDACGRTVEVTAAEVLRYSRERWPTCCGGVMVYYVESNPAAADRTPLDVPRLPPDRPA